MGEREGTSIPREEGEGGERRNRGRETRGEIRDDSNFFDTPVRKRIGSERGRREAGREKREGTAENGEERGSGEVREAMPADEEFHRVCAYGGGSGRRAGRREKREERSWGKGREMGAVGER